MRVGLPALRLIEHALEKDDFEVADRLYRQQIALHEVYDEASEYLAMLGYQNATLQVGSASYRSSCQPHIRHHLVIIATARRLKNIIHKSFQGRMHCWKESAAV